MGVPSASSYASSTSPVGGSRSSIGCAGACEQSTDAATDGEKHPDTTTEKREGRPEASTFMSYPACWSVTLPLASVALVPRSNAWDPSPLRMETGALATGAPCASRTFTERSKSNATLNSGSGTTGLFR
jgi:hypothetical protein